MNIIPLPWSNFIKPVLEITAGDSSLKLTISKVPIEDWTALLESGWGNIEETHLRYA